MVEWTHAWLAAFGKLHIRFECSAETHVALLSLACCVICVTVVVTHHAPAAGSVAERYAADWLTPAFVSDLPDGFFEIPALWVHGHL